ncbi:MAG TPA: hypothetical protein VGR02_06195 [Thermoanaerobaculia bacterium]|jgi:hypothetical protein|nr:hypothetical protein [Thermoanaerobaculia bacterium]
MEHEVNIELDLNVETLALLAQNQPAGPLGAESIPIRTCGSSSECSIPICCP